MTKLQTNKNNVASRMIIVQLLTLVIISPVWSKTDIFNTQGIEKFFHAEKVEIDTFSGELRIEPEARIDIGVLIRGIDKDVDGITLNVNNTILYINDQRSVRGVNGRSIVSLENVNVTTVVSGGGRASVSIGGQEFREGTNYSSVEMTIRVPMGTPLDLRSFNGNCQIGDTYGPVKLSLFSGNCGLGKLTNSELVVQGSGDIQVRQVKGDLRVEINGSGNIRVSEGQIDRINATVNGSGRIDLDVHAQHGKLSITGVGDIHVTAVKEQPRINVNGIGEVVVMNWK